MMFGFLVEQLTNRLCAISETFQRTNQRMDLKDSLMKCILSSVVTGCRFLIYCVYHPFSLTFSFHLVISGMCGYTPPPLVLYRDPMYSAHRRHAFCRKRTCKPNMKMILVVGPQRYGRRVISVAITSVHNKSELCKSLASHTLGELRSWVE